MVADGPSDEIVNGYIAEQLATGGAVLHLPRASGQARRAPHHRGPRGRRRRAGQRGRFTAAAPIGVEIDIDVARENAAYQVGFDLLSGEGPVLRSWHTDGPPDDWPPIRTGRSTLRCVLPAGLLNEGSYAVAPRADVYQELLDRQWRRSGLVRRGEGPSRVAVLVGQEPGAAGAAARLDSGRGIRSRRGRGPTRATGRLRWETCTWSPAAPAS